MPHYHGQHGGTRSVDAVGCGGGGSCNDQIDSSRREASTCGEPFGGGVRRGMLVSQTTLVLSKAAGSTVIHLSQLLHKLIHRSHFNQQPELPL